MWIKALCLTLTGMLCLFAFIMSVDRPILLVLGYLFGVVFVIICEELPNKPKTKDDSTDV